MVRGSSQYLCLKLIERNACGPQPQFEQELLVVAFDASAERLIDGTDGMEY